LERITIQDPVDAANGICPTDIVYATSLDLYNALENHPFAPARRLIPNKGFRKSDMQHPRAKMLHLANKAARELMDGQQQRLVILKPQLQHQTEDLWPAHQRARWFAKFVVEQYMCIVHGWNDYAKDERAKRMRKHEFIYEYACDDLVALIYKRNDAHVTSFGLVKDRYPNEPFRCQQREAAEPEKDDVDEEDEEEDEEDEEDEE
tara:strand:+ start:89 stop:703 length:615 start_codon:yes stop_codon:yes gene_type:complete